MTTAAALQAKMRQYSTETARLATYVNFPDTCPLKPPVLARAGLYYTGREDKVKCAFCLGSMYNWEQGDNPLSEHARHFPDCAFIKHKMFAHTLTAPVTAPVTGPVTASAGGGAGSGAGGGHTAAQSVVAAGPFGEGRTEADTVRAAAKPNYSDSATASRQKDFGNVTNITVESGAFEQLPAVDIVHQMGYSMKMIRKAVTRLLLNNHNLDLLKMKTDILLDVIFDMENNGYDSADDLPECDGDQSNATQPDANEVTTRNFAIASSTSSNENNTPVHTKTDTSSTDIKPASTPQKENSTAQKTSKQDNYHNILQPKSPNVMASQQSVPGGKAVASKTCSVCERAGVSVLFLPCRHLIACDACAATTKVCPLDTCGKLVSGTVKIYLA